MGWVLENSNRRYVGYRFRCKVVFVIKYSGFGYKALQQVDAVLATILLAITLQPVLAMWEVPPQLITT